MGIGNSQGTPSRVNESAIRWDKKPIKKALQTISISTITKVDIQLRRILEIIPKMNKPTIEWEIKRCLPIIGERRDPKNGPKGSLRHKLAVGWSKSGARPPIKHAESAIIAVARDICGRGWVTTIKLRAVKAARSWVLPVIILV